MTKKSIMRTPEEIQAYLAKRQARKNKNQAKKIVKELEVSDKVKELQPRSFIGLNKLGKEWVIEKVNVDVNAKLMTTSEVLFKSEERAYAVEQFKILMFKNFIVV